MKNLFKLKLFIFAGPSAICYWLFVIFPVFAADPKFELEYPGLGPLVVPVDKFIEWFFSFALGSAGVLAFGVLVFGGIKYIASAGNSSGQQDAKQWIQGAILGLILLLGSVLILSTINPDLTKLGVPPSPSFTVRGAESAVCVECLKKYSNLECGCTYKASGDLFETLSCPAEGVTVAVPVPIGEWCPASSGRLCVDFTKYDPFAGRPQKFIYCCNVDTTPNCSSKMSE